MKGCEVTQELSVTQGKFHIKLQLPSAEGMTEMILKCDTVCGGIFKYIFVRKFSPQISIFWLNQTLSFLIIS